MLAVFSAGITIFVFQLTLGAIYRPESLRKLFSGWNHRRGVPGFDKVRQKEQGYHNAGKHSFEDDVGLLLKEQNGIRTFGIRIKTVQDFYVIRIILSAAVLLVFLIAGFLFDRNLYFFSAAAAIIFYFLITAVLKGRIASRSGKVLKELPDVIDLMASLVSAGLTLDESIYYISKNLKGVTGGLFDTYRIKILEGKSRKEAFDLIGRISFCTEFRSFIKVLYQSEIIGNPIKKILLDLSRVYRNNHRDFLKMRAERMESNLIVVVFIFIFIPMLMIFLLPAIPQLKMLFG